ncbi:MAG: molybdopterin-binding protein [Peptococcaceae bacterium]|jgi:molybdenum cofactor synthesis domain-containing protein|nr:molybdopterin-binding protein [Peptococcaceae bacterium]MDH7525070.1 molybdopterin-binding protein [Peptococcaceae bacterium]
MQLNLLEKTELRITGIRLENVNLTKLAGAVADTLKLPQEKVVVVDVRSDQVAVDILQDTVEAEQVFGKKEALLRAMEKIEGVVTTPYTDIHSEGILGCLALEEGEARLALERSQGIVREMIARKKGRVKVFPTGFEIIEGQIEDTNTPYISKKMEEAGYIVERGAVLKDALEDIVRELSEAAGNSGVVITTGGVGAENKDFSIEAIQSLDPEAATPYIVKFTQGQGRHVKDGVRIGVGAYGGCLLVALPGPHDEVRTAIPVLIDGLKKNYDKKHLARLLVEALQKRLHDKTGCRAGRGTH